jgi:hypothetical protein
VPNNRSFCSATKSPRHKEKMENKFRPLSKKEESIAREIGDAAY